MNSTDQHVIVISYDAFSHDNWAAASAQPNLAKLIKKGAYTTEVQSVYPTLTYVIHSSYVTGLYPNKHGIYHNNPFQPFVPENDQDWHWFRQDIYGTTIYEVAKQHGLRTASILWPVTGKADIQYNIPEIKAVRNENQALKILKNGSKLFSLSMELKYGKYRNGIAQPELDDFITMSAVDTIKSKRPNLFLLHLIDLDDAKHAMGTTGPHIDDVICRMDRRIGKIVQAVEDAGITNKTTFIIIGDHSQLDVRYKVHLNSLFVQHGLIYEEDGEWKWRAYVQSAGGAAYLHIQSGDHEAERKALQLLHEAIENDLYGIEALYTREQLDALHVERKYRYMLEAKVGYAFEDDHTAEIVEDLHAKQKKYATHGYSPLKPNYTSNFLVSGPNIAQNKKIGPMEVVDLAPTIAAIFGFHFPPCDGQARTEIFESEHN